METLSNHPEYLIAMFLWAAVVYVACLLGYYFKTKYEK